MINQHPLVPCAFCNTRMAVPDWPVCTMCDAHALASAVPDTVEGVNSWSQ